MLLKFFRFFFRRGPARRPGCAAAFACVVLFSTFGCERTPPPEVVVYTSVDQEFAQKILAEFEKKTGIRVAALYDTEAGKTTGFVRRLQQEAARPRCDVWWSSEVFGTIELARLGVFEPYESPAAADIPPAWKDAEHRWTGLAARARALAFNPQRLKREELPQTWRELAQPQWAKRLMLANPQFGTTRGHVAACFAYWGEPAARSFLQTLRDVGVKPADGNSQAVRLVVAGAADLCMTDTDDVWVAQQRGEPVDLIYPRLDTTPDSPVLWIPCTVAKVKGGPHSDAARKLIDFLVSAEAERLLAQSDSRNVPVRPALRKEIQRPSQPSGPQTPASQPQTPEPEPLDYNRVADALPDAMRLAREILLR